METAPDTTQQRVVTSAPPAQQSAGGAVTPVPVVPVEPDEQQPGGLEPRPSGLTPVTLLLTFFLAYLLYKVQIVIILLIAGILLATAIHGPVEYLHRRRNIGRGPAILLMYLVILAGLGGLFYLLIPPVASEGARFARELPNLIATWQQRLESSGNPVIRTVAGRLNDALNTVGGVGLPTGLAVGVVQGVGGTLITIFSLFLIAFYWLTEKPLIKRAVVTLFRPSQRRRALRLWGEVEDKLGSWIRGQLILMAVVGMLATIAYAIMGLPFWLVLGVIAGLTEAIPNVGPILGAIPAVLIALTVDWKLALAVVAFVVMLQLTENAVLVPRIMKGTVGLTPLTIILAILAGSEFRGVAGALLAIPVAGAIQVILADLLSEKRRREAAETDAKPRGLLGRTLFRSRPPFVRAKKTTVGVGETAPDRPSR